MKLRAVGQDLRPVVASSLFVLSFGIGCGGSGGGCGSLQALPKDPAPFGLPASQVIEGGLQARITRSGMDKLTSALPGLIKQGLGTEACAIPAQSVGWPQINVAVCNQPSCKMGAIGCPVRFAFSSADGLDRTLVSVVDGTPPVIHADMTFDLDVPIDMSAHVDLPLIPTVDRTCTLDLHDRHYYAVPGSDPIHVLADINLGIDPVNGELTLHLGQLQIANLDIEVIGSEGCNIDLSNVPVLGTALSLVGIPTDVNIGSLINGILSIANTQVGQFLLNLVINAVRPLIDTAVQNFLPKPLGIAKMLPTASLLTGYGLSDEAHLEMLVVPGGYVQGKAGGLTVGVVAGLNSDRDESTRTADLLSEPSLCVPSRAAPDLSKPPWSLLTNKARNDFLLAAAPEFSGMPDPVGGDGAGDDVAIGLSRSFLNLAGFHLFNSGTLCLTVPAVPQLNAGTLAPLIPSLDNILEDRKSPIAIALRPEQPLSFTVGTGSVSDPLLHIAASDLRVDLYAWIEERFVRVLTLGLDANIGLGLTVTMGMDGKPTVQPTISGIDPASVKVTAFNTDLLTESPDRVGKVVQSLLGVIVGQVGGAIPAFALPQIAGFSLDHMRIDRVKTAEDDFVAIYGTITVAQTMAAPEMDWTDPAHPHPIGQLDTRATVESQFVPPAPALAHLVDDGAKQPSVTLALSAFGAGTQEVEYAFRVNRGMWHAWQSDAHPTIIDPAFLLQGHHRIEVRSRIKNDFHSEDATPALVEALIDSMPPELHPAVDGDNLVFGGFDVVTDNAALRYSVAGGAFSDRDRFSLSEVGALTHNGRLPLVLLVRDEAGNLTTHSYDASAWLGVGSTKTTASGCSMGGGGAPTGALFGALVLLGLFLRKRALVLLLGAAACGQVGAGTHCNVDDECVASCMKGTVPTCKSGTCVCLNEIPIGDVGRFSSLTMIGPEAYVAAYNNTHGDLMMGHVLPPGVVQNWGFVDGLPDEPPTVPSGRVRSGIKGDGDDVGRYTSIQATPEGEPVVAYYDNTHHALKFGSFGAVRWHAHVVDQSTHDIDQVGRWATLTIDKKGLPAIAYTALVSSGSESGKPEGQLRFAQASVANPASAKDWTISILDSRPLPQGFVPFDTGVVIGPLGDGGVVDGGAGTDGGLAVAMAPLLPPALGLMPCIARRSDDSPAVAYYDRDHGSLRYVALDPKSAAWSKPLIVDGRDVSVGRGDLGLYPSLAFDDKDVAHLAYVDGAHQQLLHVDLKSRTPEVVDDGYKAADEKTSDGLPAPVFHQVGDSASIQVVAGKVLIAYQDATAVELRLAELGGDKKWKVSGVAGHAKPFAGSHGFYTNMLRVGSQAVISSYTINQQVEPAFYGVEVFSIDLGVIQ